MKPNVGKSILGGFVGTLAMTLMMYKIGPMMGMMKMDIAAMLGNMLGGWTMGMMMHFINGTIIFPLIYVLLLFHLLPGPPAVKGLTWGTILWLLAQLMVMPIMGGGVFSSKMGGKTAVVGSLVGHIVYGALLGLIAGAGKESRNVVQPA